jgi:hypothetical protein
MKVVVARYQENVDWTNGLTDCIIYNKGSIPPNSKHPSVQLSNVGREGHTYLYHIITNYDNLDDHTCFLQGQPFDHTPDLERRFQLFQSNPVSFYLLSRNIYFINLSYDYTDVSLHKLLISTYEKVFAISKRNHHFQFGAGAQFIVSRDVIRSRPKSFYENIMRLMDHDINPPEGFVLERFWSMIFNHTE